MRAFKPKTPPVPPAPKPMADPGKAVMAAPRIKPTAMRNYGKGQSVLSTAPKTAFGAGIGFGDT